MDWRTAGLAVLWTVNGIFLVITLAAFVYADIGVDWNIYTEAGRRFFAGRLYAWEGLPYRYSPVLAPLFLVPIGYVGWALLHFAALLTIPRRLALLALVSAPFWNDVYNGNTMTFVFVAAVWALRGTMGEWKSNAVAASASGSRSAQRSRTFGGIVAATPFLLLAVLIPRPVMLPVLLWLLWRHRAYLAPFAAMFAIHALAVWLTGWGDEWIASELRNVGRDIYADIGPSMILGAWWYPIGLGIAAYCTWKGWLGPASFLASGFWSLHYGIMLLLGGDVLPRPRTRVSVRAGDAT